MNSAALRERLAQAELRDRVNSVPGEASTEKLPTVERAERLKALRRKLPGLILTPETIRSCHRLVDNYVDQLKLAFAVASLCVDPAVVRSHAVWVYTDTSALETYEHTSYTVPHIVNRSMWMERHQERHTAIFVPLGDETGLASCRWGKVYVGWIRCSSGKAHPVDELLGAALGLCTGGTGALVGELVAAAGKAVAGACSLTMTRHRPPSSRSRPRA